MRELEAGSGTRKTMMENESAATREEIYRIS